MKAARQQAIVDLLITHSSLTTETLSKQLNVSRETIRRDLSELQAQGKVLRNHGRAKVIHQFQRFLHGKAARAHTDEQPA